MHFPFFLAGWLGDLSIGFGYTTSPPEIATYPGNFPVVDTIVFDMPYTGQYLNVTTNRTTYLQICELELYGKNANYANMPLQYAAVCKVEK